MLYSAQFTDYDAYAEAIERVNARFTLQELEQPQWQIDGLALPAGIVFQHCASGSGALAQGVAAGGGTELAIPAAGHFVANGRPVPIGAALYLGEDAEFMVSIPGAHRWFNVFVPERRARALDVPGITGEHAARAPAVLASQLPGDRPLSSLLMEFIASVRAAPELADSAAALAAFESELLESLGSTYGSQPGEPDCRRGRPTVVDETIILRAIDAIEASPSPNVAAADLARLGGVSERALRGGFQKYLGLSPTRYMQLRILHRARRQLAAASAEDTTVARVATDLGIWDLGRFAARYNRLFGELPSVTLQR